MLGAPPRFAAMLTPLADYRYLPVLAALGLVAPTACRWSPESAHARLKSVAHGGAAGDVRLTTYANGKTRLAGTIRGLPPGRHGIHVHEFGDCSGPGAEAAGGHLNPHDRPHGAPWGAVHHAGDLGNIEADSDGVAEIRIETDVLTIRGGDAELIGRALIVQADPDDFTQPAGHTGARLACGVITSSPPTPAG